MSFPVDIKVSSEQLLKLGSVAVICLFVGYFVGDNSGEITRLHSEIEAQKRAATLSNKRNNTAAPVVEEPRRGRQQATPLPLDRARIDVQRAAQEWKATTESKVRDDFVAKISAERSNEYMRVFSELHLTPEQAQAFREKLADIHTKTLNCDGATTELLLARREYQQQISDALSPENYTKYRDYELSKPAKRELGLMQDYLKQEQRGGIEGQNEELLIKLVRDAGAYTVNSCEGPFDALPTPVAGREAVVAWQEQEIARIEEAAVKLKQTAAQAGFSPEVLDSIQGYYAHRVAEARTGLEFMLQPTDVQLEQVMNRIPPEQRPPAKH